MYERLMNLIKENMPDVDVSKATPEARLKEDLGMDSIGLMMLSMAIEDEFNVTFNEVVTFSTVQDVLNFLEANGK